MASYSILNIPGTKATCIGRNSVQLIVLLLNYENYHVSLSFTALANVPVVGNHKRQVSLYVGDRLRLECPIWGSNDGSNQSGGDDFNFSYMGGGLINEIIYHWNIQGLPEYAVTMDSRFRFLEDGRVVELTQPVTRSDAGIYQCSGVTGFGQKKVVFEVHIAGKLVWKRASEFFPSNEGALNSSTN